MNKTKQVLNKEQQKKKKIKTANNQVMKLGSSFYTFISFLET